MTKKLEVKIDALTSQLAEEKKINSHLASANQDLSKGSESLKARIDELTGEIARIKCVGFDAADMATKNINSIRNEANKYFIAAQKAQSILNEIGTALGVTNTELSLSQGYLVSKIPKTK